MGRARLVIAIVLLASTSAVTPSSGQTLTFTLFERYLEALREQYAVPGISWAVVQRGDIWGGGVGKRDVEANLPPTLDTPYALGNLSQIFGSTLLLRKCVDQDSLEVSDPVVRWWPAFAEPDTRVGQLLTHQAPAGGFVYNPTRFASLTDVIEECADAPYRHVLAHEIFDLVGMHDSVPGRQLDGVQNPGAVAFDAPALAHYADVLSRLARPYRIDRGRVVRSDVPPAAADAAAGAIASVHDLAWFDLALRDGLLLSPGTLTQAWTQAGGTAPMPTGLGWFVQNYNGEPLIWQFDATKDAFSSMVLKLPNRDLTLILAANSDGLTSSFALANGDATTSAFTRLFLKFFVP